MDTLEFTKSILKQVLQLGDRADRLTADTPLLDSFPEFNSLTVVGLIAAIEDYFGCAISDTEITQDIFQTVGTLAQFIQTKQS
jgi:acyl carrier protein